MKKTDIAMIILIVSVSAVVAYFVASAIPFLKPPQEAVKVKTIDRYNETIGTPNPDIFNSQAINPTVDVTIGGNSGEK